MQETVLNFIFKVSCNISCLCNGSFLSNTVCNTFLDVKEPNGMLSFFFLFTMRIKRKKGNHTNQISPSCFVVLVTLFPHQPIWDVTNVNGIKICQLLHAVTENKSRCQCVTPSQPTGRPRPAPDWVFFLNSVAKVDVWRVNRATEPKQNKTWVEIQATNMCFQSGHSQHPTGFLFNSTQLLPYRKIRACFFSPWKVLVLVVILVAFVVFCMVCSLSAWSQVIIVSICS